MTPDDCRARRVALGLSLGRLAILAGLAERTVWQFEMARVAPRPGTLIALRRGFRAAEQATPAGRTVAEA